MRDSLDIADIPAGANDLPPFIAEIERLVAPESDPHAISAGVRTRLTRLITIAPIWWP